MCEQTTHAGDPHKVTRSPRAMRFGRSPGLRLTSIGQNNQNMPFTLATSRRIASRTRELEYYALKDKDDERDERGS